MGVKTDNLPDGYHILKDGQNREVLMHESWQKGVVFFNRKAAVDYAKYLEEEVEAGRFPR